MFLSEAEAEAALRDLRHRRDALDRAIAEHQLYLELGRRLGGPVHKGPEIAKPKPRLHKQQRQQYERRGEGG